VTPNRIKLPGTFDEYELTQVLNAAIDFVDYLFWDSERGVS